MSLINKIVKIFSEQEKQKQKLDISDAIKIIEDQKNEKANIIIEDSYKNALQIYSEIHGLRSIISDFKKVRVEEKRAKASNDVKDRFCTSSENQLSSIEKPEKDLGNIKDFLSRTERTFASLGGLTHKQMMHIGFFFKGEVSAISKKTALIDDLVRKAKKNMSGPEDYEKFFMINGKIRPLENKISDKSQKRKLVENESEKIGLSLKDIENDINNINISQLNEAEREFAESEYRKGFMEQELISLLAVERMFKKLRHQKNLRDEILDNYIKYPSKAVINDEEMKIFQFVEQTLELDRKNLIEMDAKSRQKLARILENKDHIKQKRKELLESLERMEARKRKLENVRNIIEEKKKSLQMAKSSLEMQLNNNRRELEKIDADLADAKKKIEDHRNELKTMAQRLTGSEIE